MSAHDSLPSKVATLRAQPLVAVIAAVAAWIGFSAPTVAAPDATAAGLIGRWLTDNGNLEVEIAPCGAAFCGTVVKVLANRSMSGSGEMVAADPRPALGMTILKDLAPSGEGSFSGEIYNRENAKTYSCNVSIGGPDQLIVRPYVALPLFGKTLVWKRVASRAEGK